jgi:hypothetical protein
VKVCKDTTHIVNSSDEGAMLWHERFGHLNMTSLKELDAMVNDMNLKEVSLHHICEGCIKGKHQITSFRKDKATRVSQLLEIVHTHVCGPMRTTSHGGARIPSDPKVKLQRNVNGNDESKEFPYQQVVGSLMYAMLCTRPNLAYLISL